MLQNFVVAPQSFKQSCNKTLGVGTARWECDTLIIADDLSEVSDYNMSKITMPKPKLEILTREQGVGSETRLLFSSGAQQSYREVRYS